jgi:NADP-dependent 3-hydroxy acid dehydrogenase YdfG
MMAQMTNKNIVITGASKGIGRATALALAGQQVTLGLVARSLPELEQLQQEVEALGSQCIVVAGSVAEESTAQKTIALMTDRFGGVDILINNAGFGNSKPFEAFSEKEWDELYATNVKGTFLFSKAVAPVMKANKAGHIIIVASDVAKRTFATGALYCSSKYAQHAFGDAIRKELRPYGIKVGTVYSGLVDSQFHPEGQGNDSHAGWLKNEDMARSIVFMISQPKHVVIDELMIHPLEQDY